ncbi:Centrosomal protein of 290 kDa (Cep290) [Durusdinium trenchii]|uniref:Centrosomal protein of 290 kDa (Cep290) n=1 Tax=Durusdinium trenchii TaxID=1381693 RepID=A0ABP0HHF3_9DINO
MGASAEELQAQLDEAMQLFEEQLAEKDDEIAELRERNKQLEDELLGEGRGGDLELRDELRDLRNRLEQAEDELEKAMDAAKDQESRAREFDMQNKALKMDKLKLETELQKEQERAEAMEESMHTMRQRTAQATESQGRIGAREKTNKKNLVKLLGENEDLRAEVANLETDVQTLFQAVNEKDGTIKQMEEQLVAAQQELRDNESEVEELKRLLKDKEREISDAHDEINAVAEMEVEIEDRVRTKVEKWKEKVKALQKDLEGERHKQAELQKKCDSLLLESGLREIEKQLVTSEDRNRSLVKELKASKAMMDQQHLELVTLARDNENLKADQGSFIEVALEKERQEMERLKHIIANKDRALEEEHARYRELDEQKAQLEEELQDREFTLAEYERGHGLTEAVAKQKKLREAIVRRDREIRRLNQTLSERIGAHEKLYETCRRLKKKAGLPEDFEFDQLELEEGMRGQTERLKGLIHELEQQNEALENERFRLLDSLRKNAVNMGEKGMKLYGLSAEQVVHVNNFIENLREGRVDLPLDDRSLEFKEEIRELKHRLREVERDLASAEMQLEKGGLGPATAEGLQDLYERGDRDAGGRGGLESSHLQKFATEQQQMMAELKLELQRTIQSVVGMQRHSPAGDELGPHTPPSSPKNDPGYERLMHMLQDKLDANKSGGHTAMDREQVESMRNELERQSAMNEQLLKRLQEAEAVVGRFQTFGQQQQYQQQQQQQRSPLSPSARRSHLPEVGGDGAQLVLSPTGATVGEPPVQQLAALSRVGTRFHERQISMMRLPPEEWAEPYILLNNKLTICMERLVEKEKDAARLERSLREYEQKIEVYANQMALLYREHAESKSDWEETRSTLTKEADEARNERDALRAKARRLDTLCAVLEGDENTARGHVKELTRKLAILEVNEVVLARKYNLIAEENRSTRNEKEILQHEMVQAETALRERVLYLEEWKAGAQAQLESLQKSVELCVPRNSHEAVVRKLANIKHKYRELLGREAQLRSKTSGAQALRRRVHDLETELEVLRTECLKAKQDAQTNREQLEWFEARSKQTVEPGTEEDTSRQLEALVQQRAKLKGELLEKEIVLASSIKKAEIMEKRASELSKDLQQEVERADQAEIALESAREVANKIEQELIEFRDTYQGGASRAERKVLEERITELENLYGSLTRETQRFRELADIASSQVQAFEMMQQGKEQELESLRKQLLEVNARSDDDAIIGKVQHELTTTKVSYHMFVRKFEKASVAIRRNELELRKLEGMVDEKDRMIRHTREEARARILALEAALEQLGGVPEDPTGLHTQSDVSLKGMERLSETIARLGESAEQSEEALRRSEAMRRNLESELEAQALEVDSTRSILRDLKSKIFGGASAAQDVDVDAMSEHQRLAKRLLELNEDLKTSKLDSMRVKRELELLRDEKFHVEKLRERDEEHMQRLEEAIANAENALRRHEDTMRLQRASSSGAHDGFGLPVLALAPYRGNGGQGEKGDKAASPDPARQINSPGATEAADSRQERSELVAELQRQVREADEREQTLENRLEKQKEQLRYLQKRLKAEGLRASVDTLDEAENEEDGENRRSKSNSIGRNDTNYYEADARKLQAAAQQTIASLKDIVNRKNQTIEGLKHKMELGRKSALAERERDQAEIERLTEKLYEDNRSAIGKLRAAYEDVSKGMIPGQDGPSPEDADHAMHREMMDRLEEADVILERKDRRILELEGVVEELRILRQKAEDRAGQSAEIADKLRDKVKQISLHQASQAQDNLVRQLRGQLVAKDKKLGGLRAAVVALKTEFVKAEEDHEEELIRRDREIAELSRSKGPNGHQQQKRSPTGDMRNQLEALRERVERSREDLESTKRREEKLRSENGKLKRQLREREDADELNEAQLSQNYSESDKLRKKIDDLRRENRRLKESLTNHGDEAHLDQQRSRIPPPRAGGADLERLAKRIKVLEAQNTALRTQSGSAAGSSTTAADLGKWEADKKLERRVATLSRKLEERTKEAEAFRAQAEQAKQLLERTTRERATLQTRLNRGGNGVGSSSNSNSNLVKDQDRVVHLKREVEDLRGELQAKEAANQDLRRQVQVEQRGELARLQRDLTATRGRCAELEDEVEALRMRKRHRSNGADSLEVAEEQYAREDELRQQLSDTRKELRSLEGDLLERDNTILELRFELEQESLRSQRTETKHSELVPFEASVAGSPSSAAARRKPGERFKRERDLENVVDSLKKVVSKLQGENERLKRNSGSNIKYTELSRQVKTLRQENEQLLESNQTLKRRSDQSVESSAKLVRLEDVLRNLKRQLRDRGAALDQAKRRVDDLTKENQQLVAEVEDAGFHREQGSVAASETENALRRRLAEQERLIESMRNNDAPSATAADDGEAREEVRRLRQENERLLNELSAFDLDFFEEIEDLKYKYQQTLDHNRQLQRRLDAAQL